MSRSTTRPSLGASFKRLVIPIAAVAITAVATHALGGSPSLIAIPTLPGDYNNMGRAITPDGLWVAGDSVWGGSRGFLYSLANSNVYNVLASGAQATTATGVCYRDSGGQQQVIVGGMAAGWNADYCFANGAFISSCRRDIYNTGGHPKPATGIANTRTWGGGDVVWGGWSETTDGPGRWVAISRVSGDWKGASTTVTNDYDTSAAAKSTIYGLSGAGRAVGVISSLNGCVWDWTGSGVPTVWQFNGMDGTLSQEAFAISADGTIIFGRSYSSDPVNRPFLRPYKATFDTNMPGPAPQLSINELPSFPDTAGSTSLGLPYGCSADGKYAVGYSYRSGERAVVWDTSDPDPAKWTVLDLMQFATNQGIAGIFTGLTRAYSVGITAGGDLAITGYGIVGSGEDAWTRAFLMIVPRPLSAYSVYPPTLNISNNLAGYTFRFNSILTDPLTPTPLTNYVEYTTVLSNAPTPSTWTTLIATQCNGVLTTLVDPKPPDAQRFYRIRTQ